MRTLQYMDWWYKSEKHGVSQDTILRLEDAVKTVLREGKSLATVKLFDDGTFFYIKTDNRIALNHFLNSHGFEELYEDEEPQSGLNLRFG